MRAGGRGKPKSRGRAIPSPIRQCPPSASAGLREPLYEITVPRADLTPSAWICLPIAFTVCVSTGPSGWSRPRECMIRIRTKAVESASFTPTCWRSCSGYVRVTHLSCLADCSALGGRFVGFLHQVLVGRHLGCAKRSEGLVVASCGRRRAIAWISPRVRYHRRIFLERFSSRRGYLL